MSSQPPQHFNFDQIQSQQESFDKRTKKVKKSLPPKRQTKPVKATNKCGCRSLDPTLHTYCTKGCGCSKNGLECSSKCGCKGSCYNGKSIPEALFFKVWRNIVLRTEIIGDKRCEVLVEKNGFKKEVTDTLKTYNIQYNENDINQYTKMFNSSIYRTSIIVSVPTVLEKYFGIERGKRQQYIQAQYKLQAGPEHSNIFRASKSEILKKYIFTLLPEEQLKLPSIQEIVAEEIEAVKTIKETLKSVYQEEGLKFDPNSPLVISFIQSCSIDTTPLIQNEIHMQSSSKRNKVFNKLRELGITNITNGAQIEAYINTFKESEIAANGVWSFDDIINAGIKANYVSTETMKRTKTIEQMIKASNLIFRRNSELVIKYIKNIPPIPKSLSSSKNKTDQIQLRIINGLSKEVIVLDSEDEEDTKEAMSIDVGDNKKEVVVHVEDPTIQQVIEYEREQIEVLKESVKLLFLIEGLKFDQQSINYTEYIQRSGFNQDMSRISLHFVTEEIKLQKVHKEVEVRSKFNESGISSPMFYDEKQKYINTFKPSEILEKRVLSLDQLIQKEKLARIKLLAVSQQLEIAGIKVREEMKSTDVAIKYFNTTAEEEADNVEMKSRFLALIEYETGYRERKTLVKQRLEQVGLKRKKMYYTTNLSSFVENPNSGLTIDQLINQEIQIWKSEKSLEARGIRYQLLVDAIEYDDLEHSYYEGEVLPNPFIDKFLAGTLTEKEWESHNLESIIEHQLDFTRDYIDDLPDSDDDSDDSDDLFGSFHSHYGNRWSGHYGWDSDDSDDSDSDSDDDSDD